MDALEVPLSAAAALLVLSGPRKIARPVDAARALRATGLPSDHSLVRGVGAIEFVVGLGVILDGDRAPWPLALGTVYAAFAAFVLLAVWCRAPLSSCGCFGGEGVAPTPLHAGIDAGAAAIGFLAALDPPTAPICTVRDGGGDAVALIAGAVVVTAATYWVFTRWTGIRSARSTPPRR
jgi:hypothetical protein